MAARLPLVIGPNGRLQQLQSGDTLSGVSGGGGSTIFVGNAVVNFGAAPGNDIASVTITGQTGILTTSYVNANIAAKATSDHTVDEHLVEELDIFVGDIVAATGFTIYVKSRKSNVYGQWSVSWLWS